MTNQRRLSLCTRCHEGKDTSDARPLRSLDPKFSDSNYVPTDTEVVQWRRIMMEEKNELTWYKEEIALLQRKVDHLEANIEKCHSALSITRRIPSEIWETIFSDLCASLDIYSLDIDFVDDSSDSDDDDSDSDTHPHVIVEAPTLTLSQVCARWRSIVHRCSRFWSSIRIQFGVPCRVATLLQTYLDRSQTHPLSLRLYLPPEHEYESNRLSSLLVEDKGKAWSIVAPHLGRCRKLILGVAEMSDLLEVPELAFPKLESFQNLSCEWVDTEGFLTGASNPRWFWDAIREASQLKDVTLRDLLPLTSLPYQQLTSLTAELTNQTAGVLLRLLPTCMALASLKILDLEGPYTHGGHVTILETPIGIPSLRHLAIEVGREKHVPYSGTSLLPRWCSKLNLPALNSFSIVCHMGWRLYLPSIIQQWAKTLRNVTIALPVLLDQNGYDKKFLPNLLPMLETLVHLTHLELVVSRHDNCFLAPTLRNLLTMLCERLNQETEKTAFLPKLQSLNLTSSDVRVSIEFMEGLLKVVSSRRVGSTACPLTRFHITLCAPYPAGQAKLDPDVLERMKVLEKEGIDIVFGDLRY